MQRQIGSLAIECVDGDIVRQGGFDAIVNAANAALTPGGGVCGAIHRAAGPGHYEECRPLAPIRTGQAVITSAHDLPNRFVIHCLGPVYGVDHPAPALLAKCYRSVLRLADESGVASLAVPAISTGIFGYPLEEAAKVAIDAVCVEAPALRNLRRLRFVLRGEAALRAHVRAIEAHK